MRATPEEMAAVLLGPREAHTKSIDTFSISTYSDLFGFADECKLLFENLLGAGRIQWRLKAADYPNTLSQALVVAKKAAKALRDLKPTDRINVRFNYGSAALVGLLLEGTFDST